MEDDIILTDDIILVDETNSLPPVLTPLPNTPSPASFANQHSAKASTVSTWIGGACAVGGEPLNGAGYRTLGVEVCKATDCCVQRPCLWHKFVLTYPQYVIWEAFTKTIVLEKQQHASFGFKYKVKKFDGPPAEVFALVTEVMSGGVAWAQLLPGDWIRSINGTPVNTAKEAFRPDFRSLSSLRLVIQRPEGLSPKGIPRLKQQARSLRISLHIPPAPPEPSSSDHQSPGNQQFVLAAKTDRVCGAGDKDLTPGSGSDPLLEQYPRLAQSPGEHIPLATLVRPSLLRKSSTTSSDKCVLPWARVVVCGAHGSAADYVRNLLTDVGEVEIDPEAVVQTFHLSLHRTSGSGVSVSSQPEPLFSLKVESGYGQDGDDGLKCVNMELYLINNEEFFHHCMAWLLPVSSLVILTFPVHKLLNQPQLETQRLMEMVHSLQAGSSFRPCPNGSHPQVLMYGVPSGAQHDISAEEVQVMFYVTDSGSRLLKDHKLSVNVLGLVSGDSVVSARLKLFSSCQDQASRLPVQPCVARVVDNLSGLPALGVNDQELGQMVSRVLGDMADPVVTQSVISDLLAAGHLLACDSNKASSAVTDQEYLLPLNLFQAVSSLFIKPLLDSHSPDSRQKWFKLISTGRVSRAEFLDILSSESSCLSLTILEHLGIVFRLWRWPNCCGDSGFAEESLDFVVPFFLMDTTENSEEVRGQKFVLRFEGSVTLRGYFHMLRELSALAASEEVVVRGQGYSVVRHNGLLLHLQWRSHSDSNTIMVTVARSDGHNRERVTVQQMQRLFSAVVPAVPFKVLMADSLNPSSHLPSKSPAASPGADKINGSPFFDEEETLLKPAVGASEPADTTLGAGQEMSYRDLPLTALSWTVLNQVALQLTISMATGHDWRRVAEEAGKSVVEICAYEAITSREVPAMNFLREYILTANVQQFLDILEKLDRPDVRDLILNHLKERTPQS